MDEILKAMSLWETLEKLVERDWAIRTYYDRQLLSQKPAMTSIAGSGIYLWK